MKVIDPKMPGEFVEPHVKRMEEAVERAKKERAKNWPETEDEIRLFIRSERKRRKDAA